MKIIFRCFIFFSLSLFLVSGCLRDENPKKVDLSFRSVPEDVQQDDAQSDALSFGLELRLSPKDEYRIYSPFLNYLARETGRDFLIRFTKEYKESVDDLGRGAIHFAAIGPLSFIVGREKYGHGIGYLANGVNFDGDPRYRTVIITLSESGVADLKDLRGRSFAFGSRMSALGHLIPRHMLEEAGVGLQDLGEYSYTGSDLKTLSAVLNGDSDAGGVQDLVAEKLVREGKIMIVKISDPYPSRVIAYNTAVDSRTVRAVRSALLAYDPTGRHKNSSSDWKDSDMPLGFTTLNTSEFYRVAVLARKYGLLKQ